jgi:hypothetical protein
MNRQRFIKKSTVVKKPVAPPALTEDYRTLIREKSYLGKKGYTIPIENLTPDDFEHLHKDLFVKATNFGPKYGVPGSEQDVAFPVYRENAKKIYVPRFYGIERYGLPPKSEITRGDAISVDFVKPLRDYQENIIDVYMKHVQNPICANNDIERMGSGGILEVPCGRGKCLGKGTPVLMFDGSIKMVQNIRKGDQLMGDDSKSRNVVSIARGKETMYKVHTDDGGYIVNESHILSLKFPGDDHPLDISVLDYFKTNNGLMGYRVPVNFKEIPVLQNPYDVGRSVCDGGILPKQYKYNSNDIQLKVLEGIFDTIGQQSLNKISISKTDRKQLLDDITFMSRCVGYVVERGIMNESLIIHTKPNSLKYQIRVEKLDVDDYYGFEIDGNRRFLLGDLTTTHNTVIALKIISLLKKKTLIVVHKEFLMNQWIERAAEFVPSAKIGKIQGPVFDVEGKDIVIGMLQTLYERELPEGAFDSFGLTVVDEVHRIGSEQFSKTLLRSISPYMLGISATVDRKDGLTRVLYMFIGPKIYSEQRKDEDPVCVRALEYISSDPDFNEVEYDFRGNPKFSTMISKLCAFGPRSDFVVRVLQDLVSENGESQIMVLCHNRCLLKYLYEAINHRAFATVGYYVGGMKQADLQTTEGKQIVLATYAMAAEALDIKTLSTLVMATPKTDIVQSVGRILRVKHDNPIIVDIVDRHDLFQNQFRQRKTFYRKCNYRILSMDSVRYNGMSLDWSNDKTWTNVFEPKNLHNNAVDSETKERKCLIKMNSDVEGTPGSP